MNRPISSSRRRKSILVPLLTALGLTALLVGPGLVNAGQPPSLEDGQFEAKLRFLKERSDDAERLRVAKSMLSEAGVSSQQVKAIALTLRGEAARLEFATAAYPYTVDPENYYDVYDVFTTFSKVFRLRDRIQPPRQLSRPPVVARPRPVSQEELAEIIRTLQAEGFDDSRQALARQIIGSRGGFRSSQIREILRVFAFDEAKVEVAKLAYDYTLDPGNYHVVYDALAFSSSKETLARHIESRSKPTEAPERR